jgi:hypothetical protein
MKKILLLIMMLGLSISSISLIYGEETSNPSIYSPVYEETNYSEFGMYDKGFDVVKRYDIAREEYYYVFQYLAEVPQGTSLQDYNKLEIYLPTLIYQAVMISPDNYITYTYDDPNNSFLDNVNSYSRITFVDRNNIMYDTPIYDEIINQGKDTSFFNDGTSSGILLTYDIINNLFITTTKQTIYVDDIKGIWVNFNTDIYEDEFSSYDCVLFPEGHPDSECNLNNFQDIARDLGMLENYFGTLGRGISNEWFVRLYGEGIRINFYHGLNLLDTKSTFKGQLELNEPVMEDSEELEFYGWRYGNKFITSLEMVDIDMLDENGELNLQAVYLTKDGEQFTMPNENEASNVILTILKPFNLDNVFGTTLVFFIGIMAITLGLAGLKAPLMVYLIVYLALTILWLVLGLLPTYVAIIFLLIIALLFVYITGGKNYE